MGLGLSGAFGAVGAMQGLRAIQDRAIEEQQRQAKAAQQEFLNKIALDELQNTLASGDVNRKVATTRLGIDVAGEGRAADTYAKQQAAKQALIALNPIAGQAETLGWKPDEFYTDEMKMQRALSQGQREGASEAAAYDAGGRRVFSDKEGIQTGNQLRLIGARSAADLANARVTSTEGPNALLAQTVLANPSVWRSLTDKTRGEIAPALAAGGFNFRAADSLTPSMGAGVARLKTSLDMLKTLDSNLTQRRGMAGKVEGGLQSAAAAVTGENDPVTLYGAVSDALLPALARSSGEVGNLAEQEQVRYSRLAPKSTDPINIRRAKYAAIQYIIDAAEQGKTADELKPFLDYMQFDKPLSSPAPGGRSGGPAKKSAEELLRLYGGGR